MIIKILMGIIAALVFLEVVFRLLLKRSLFGSVFDWILEDIDSCEEPIRENTQRQTSEDLQEPVEEYELGEELYTLKKNLTNPKK